MVSYIVPGERGLGLGMNNRMTGDPAPAAGISRWRRGVSLCLGALVMASSLYVGTRRSVQDLTVAFRDAPPEPLPPTHVTQVEIVKKRVPKGSAIIYFMDRPEVWQFGLWKRSLYPDYLLIPIAGTALINSAQFDALRYRYQIRYVLLAAASLPRLRWSVPLPAYPNGRPMALAELEN